MPEAVIVDSVRTPIGRAFKGALKDLRPDETAAFIIDALLERNEGLDPKLVEDVYMGCGLPQGLQANNIGRIAVLLSKHLGQQTNGVTVSRYCASSLETIRLAANNVVAGPGRLLHRRRRRVRLALQRAAGGGAPGGPERAPPGQQRRPGRVHRDGPDGGERRRALRR